MKFCPTFTQVDIYNKEDGETKIIDCYGNYVIIRGLENIKKKFSKREQNVFLIPEHLTNFKKIYNREYIEINQIHILNKFHLSEEKIEDMLTVLIESIEELFPNRIILINTKEYKKYFKNHYIDISKQIGYKNGYSRIYTKIIE